MTILPPKYSPATVAAFMAMIITGMMAMMRMPTDSPAPVRSSLEVLNFFRSWSSRTKAFTTRMATRFSCRVLFRASILVCRVLNSLVQVFIRYPMTSIIRGMTTAKIRASLALR